MDGVLFVVLGLVVAAVVVWEFEERTRRAALLAINVVALLAWWVAPDDGRAFSGLAAVGGVIGFSSSRAGAT